MRSHAYSCLKEACKGAQADEKPQHKVQITKPFYLGKYEVTQAEWKAVMGTEPWKGKEHTKEGNRYAASSISQPDAIEFAEKLSKRDGVTYKLPTEAQWEYACRAGTKTRWHFGNDATLLPDHAWFTKNTTDAGESFAHEVGAKKPNPWGFFDMHGNVYEWCSDYYDESYYRVSPTLDPENGTKPKVDAAVLRGGSWTDGPMDSLSSNRNWGSPPSFPFNFTGFRLVRIP